MPFSFIENYKATKWSFWTAEKWRLDKLPPFRMGARRNCSTHSDHFNQPQTRRCHLGALSFIKKIVETRGSVLLIAPERFKVWMEEFAQVSDFGLKMSNLSLVETFRDGPFKIEGSGTEITFDADHCHEDVVIPNYFESRERIVYSGDTPCDSVIDNAFWMWFNCAMKRPMSNDLIHEAIIRKTLYNWRSWMWVVRSKSRGLLLTHFSQRLREGSFEPQPRDARKCQSRHGVDFAAIPLKEIGKCSGSGGENVWPSPGWQARRNVNDSTKETILLRDE